MKVEIDIISATVVQDTGTDTLLLKIDVPIPYWPWNGNAILRIDCAYDYGEQYCLENFHIQPEVVKRTEFK